jgi:hypothetical protein
MRDIELRCSLIEATLQAHIPSGRTNDIPLEELLQYIVNTPESLATMREAWLKYTMRTTEPHVWDTTEFRAFVLHQADIYSTGITALTYAEQFYAEEFHRAAITMWRAIWNRAPEDRTPANIAQAILANRKAASTLYRSWLSSADLKKYQTLEPPRLHRRTQLHPPHLEPLQVLSCSRATGTTCAHRQKHTTEPLCMSTQDVLP